MPPNPCELPAASPSDCVNREQRNGLTHVIQQFLAEKSSAFEFDEALDQYRNSADPTVRFVTDALWHHYDDCDDHLVTLSKLEWDYFQRLLLLLDSDGQITITSPRRWSWTQLAAFVALLAFAWCVWHFGWGQHLLIFSMPFGLVSIFISRIRSQEQRRRPYDEILTPFSTFSELRATYRSAITFSKSRYPRRLTNRRVRSRVAQFGVLLQVYAAWLMLSPIPLLAQAFPMTETQTSVKAVTKE